jgi:CcmD family protein
MKKGQRDKVKGARLFFSLGLCVWCVGLFAVSVFAQQPPTPPDGFVPASSLPGQEQLPAAPLVIAAYSIVWLLVLGYVWSVWNRIARAERELADVSRRIAAAQRQ